MFIDKHLHSSKKNENQLLYVPKNSIHLAKNLGFINYFYILQ